LGTDGTIRLRHLFAVCRQISAEYIASAGIAGHPHKMASDG